ncbi:MAG TPA: 50S ribosomal protein L29 [Acidobacteriaceae bacterium]|nr:50S ribosomal protein L29 [Acidobacteriaceae bacterium]
MELEKIRNLGDNELAVEANKAAEQLFRLRFQLTLGQTDAIKKVRLLRKDIARFKTIARERELGLHGAEHKADVVAAEKTEKKTSHVSKARRGAPTAAKKAPANKAAKKATAKSGTEKEAR